MASKPNASRVLIGTFLYGRSKFVFGRIIEIRQDTFSKTCPLNSLHQTESIDQCSVWAIFYQSNSRTPWIVNAAYMPTVQIFGIFLTLVPQSRFFSLIVCNYLCTLIYKRYSYRCKFLSYFSHLLTYQSKYSLNEVSTK